MAEAPAVQKDDRKSMAAQSAGGRSLVDLERAPLEVAPDAVHADRHPYKSIIDGVTCATRSRERSRNAAMFEVTRARHP
jgi:hypothetical protein